MNNAKQSIGQLAAKKDTFSFVDNTYRYFLSGGQNDALFYFYNTNQLLKFVISPKVKLDLLQRKLQKTSVERIFMDNNSIILRELFGLVKATYQIFNFFGLHLQIWKIKIFG